MVPDSALLSSFLVGRICVFFCENTAALDASLLKNRADRQVAIDFEK